MSGAGSSLEDKKQKLKRLLEQLHQGTSPAELREDFQRILGAIAPSDIAQIEQELIQAGVPKTEIRRLCDVHLSLMRESLEAERAVTPPWHPLHTLMQEHDLQLRLAEDLRVAAGKLASAGETVAPARIAEEVDRTVAYLMQAESHYVREENVLFPYLEKHDITEPPAVMWMDHDAIRKIKKDMRELKGIPRDHPPKQFAESMQQMTIALWEQLANHFYKENRILFPTALRVIEQHEWLEIRKQCDELGYCPFTPKLVDPPKEPATTERVSVAKGSVSFESGRMLPEEIEAVLNTLPVDLTFVGKDDTVRYFSMGKERIFPRTPAIIGRHVQQCHPDKSVHVVNQILEDFKAGRRNVAEFWLNLEGKFVYIRYFPVRDKRGDYLGCLEVTQDIAPLRNIAGEKRLLD